MEEAPIAQEESPSVGKPAERNITQYEEQLQRLADRLNELRNRFDRLILAGMDKDSEMDIKNDLATLERRLELLHDYLRTFEMERKIEEGRLDEVKEELNRLFVKYSGVTDSDFVFTGLTSRIRRLLWHYQDKLSDERHRLSDEISRLEDDVRRTAEKILEELR